MKSTKVKSCYRCGEPRHVACDCKVKMVVVEENLTMDDSRQAKAKKQGGTKDEDS